MECPAHISEFYARRQDNLRVCWDGYLKQFGIVKLHPSREVGKGNSLCVSGYVHRPERGPIFSKTGRPNYQDWPGDLTPVVKCLVSPEEFLPGTRYQTLQFETEEERLTRERRQAEEQDRKYVSRIKEEAAVFGVEADRYAKSHGLKDHTSTMNERVAIQKNAEESFENHAGMNKFTQIKKGFVNE